MGVVEAVGYIYACSLHEFFKVYDIVHIIMFAYGIRTLINKYKSYCSINVILYTRVSDINDSVVCMSPEPFTYPFWRYEPARIRRSPAALEWNDTQTAGRSAAIWSLRCCCCYRVAWPPDVHLHSQNQIHCYRYALNNHHRLAYMISVHINT